MQRKELLQQLNSLLIPLILHFNLTILRKIMQ